MDTAVLACDGVFDSGLAAVLDVLSHANTVAQRSSSSLSWNVTTVGVTTQVRTGAGHLVPAEPLARAESCDLLIVPARAGHAPTDVRQFVSGDDALPLRDLISHSRRRGTAIASACAGTFLLAEAGVLDGLRATTTWWLAQAFRARYPGVRLDESRMVVTCDGIITAGAAFGHVDLALAVVRATSPAVADQVARHLVIDERLSQSAYTIPSARALTQSDPLIVSFERWVRERLAEPISIPHAAESIGVSERTLQRTVQRTLGTSPIRFVQDLRIEQASHLLRTTSLSLEAIARRVGYEHPHTLRMLMRQRTGKTTKDLRNC